VVPKMILGERSAVLGLKMRSRASLNRWHSQMTCVGVCWGARLH
jgi:hypothetical protein